MFPFRLIILVLLCFLVAGLAGCNHSAARPVVAGESSVSCVPIEFETDYEVAAHIARQQKKPLLLYFYSNDCRFSTAMTPVFEKPAVCHLAIQFICVKIETKDVKNRVICDKYSIQGTPTVQFVSPTGTALQRITQVQTEKILVNQMRNVLYAIAWKDHQ